MFFKNLWDTVKPIIDAVGGVFGNDNGLSATSEDDPARMDVGNELYAPNAAQEESRQMQLTQGRGTITVKSEDGTPLEVDSGNMNETGRDMHSLGRDGA